MAFFLTPRFAPAYQYCSPFGYAPSRPRYSRSSAPSFVPFLSHIDGLLGEIDREVRHAAHQERQQRKRAFRARFDVKEHKDGYEILGDVPGFEQEHISIQVTDETTLQISGDTEWKAEQPAEQPLVIEPNAESDEVDSGAATPAGSDTESQKSYQPTVEDDFEDLGADASPTATTPAPTEPKGKEKVDDKPKPSEAAMQKQHQPETRELLSERVHGSFERTFQFSERIDMANVTASLKNGVLSVVVPKAPAFQTKRISIQ